MIGEERRSGAAAHAMPAQPSQIEAGGRSDADSKKAEERRAQRLRFRRLQLAVFGYSVLMAVMTYLWWDGQINLNTGGIAAVWGGLVLFNAMLAATILSGRNLSLRDPSMTAMQTLAVIILLIFVASRGNTVTAQDACAMGIEVGLLFGMFHLGWRGLAALAAIGFVGFSIIAVLSTSRLGLNAHGTAARLVIVGGVLAWTSFFASYVGGLRARLRSRNSELRATLARLEQVVRHDALTGIYNRTEVLRQLADALEEGLRSGLPVSVSLFDLDHFKQINDTYGHTVGDEVLCEFVRRVQASARSIDRLGRIAEGHGFGRFGGEEFLLVLPVTPLNGAKEAAERIRSAITDRPFLVGEDEIPVTVSQGVAQAERGEDVRSILARADDALYRAKGSGRNCVRVARNTQRSGRSGQ